MTLKSNVSGQADAPRPVWASYALAGSLVATWIAIAGLTGHPLSRPLNNVLALRYGAIDGSTLTGPDLWRLISAQWIHQKPAHLLFNAFTIAFAGRVLECRLGWTPVMALYLVGGIVGLIASVWAYPSLVSSGASQGMMSLLGLSLLAPLSERKFPVGWFVVAVLTAVQIGLDLTGSHTIKVGHIVGLVIGLGFGAVLIGGRSTRLRALQG